MALSQPDRMSGDVAPAYVRHKPEQTLLYQLVEQYWPEFQAQLNETGRFLPRHVVSRIRCDSCWLANRKRWARYWPLLIARSQPT